MKNFLLLFILSSIVLSCNPNTKKISFDLAILNGNIIDGTGKPAVKENLYINGDSIAYVGILEESKINLKKTIDATGKYVCPGFIDLHAHGNPLKTPEFENFLAMGVTTITLGQDGSSPKLINLSEYLKKVDKQKLGPNIIQFIGHGTLRELSGIGVKQIPSDIELQRMIDILEANLPYCFGMSTGLEYSPGLNAKQNELLALSKIVGKHHKMIMSHMRNEDDNEILNSIDELAKQGKYCRVHISHLKSVYGKGSQRAYEILDTIKSLQKKGITITADIYPYLASYTGISIVFPIWSKTNKQFIEAKNKRKVELETFIKNKVNSRNGPEATLFGTEPYTGKTLAQVAKEKNKSFEKFLVEDLGPQGASAAYFVMDKNLQNTLLTDSILAICSDGSLTGSHPRGHGAFAKVIEDFVIKKPELSIEEAIRKMTSYSALILHLKNRGKLKSGNKADVLIFDLKNIKATATYEKPHLLAKGFETVIVNGKISWQNMQLIKPLNGKFLIPEQ